jgi:hypothetical protein
MRIDRRTQSAIANRLSEQEISVATSVYAPRSVALILWVRKKSVADREYARPHIGASITGLNSGNGVLPTREPKQVENKNNAANDRAKRNQLREVSQPLTRCCDSRF